MLRRRSQLFLLFFFILFQVRSQNLVPNPGFEDLIQTPCSFMYSSYEFDMNMANWTSPNYSSPDIYTTSSSTSCYSNSLYMHPYAFGIQTPRTGNNMCGVVTYGDGYLTNYREYLQVQLTSPLIIGQTYYAEMYVSNADFMYFNSNNIGMYFSAGQVYQSIYSFLNLTPQIVHPTIITDTDNWIKISGTFTATHAAEYLIIGNFNNDVSTSVSIIPPNYDPNVASCAYYYIDDVLVKSICTPHDSTASICKGSSITLDLNDNFITGWSLESAPNTIISNTSTLVVSPEVTTSYVAHHDCDSISIFKVIVDPMPTFNFGKDSTLCQGQSIFFDATTEHATYLWQDGSTNPTYTVGSTGHYTLTITNGCSSISDDVFITVNTPSTFSFGTDTTICSGETIRFNATSDGATYLWQDGSTNPTYTAVDTGHYAVTIKNICGTSYKNITLYNCCEGAKIPNLITPNGDGKNETFYIDCYGNGDYELSIYNTWGAIIYHNNAYLNNWGGEHVSDGIYYYVIRYKTQSINSGWVQVLR